MTREEAIKGLKVLRRDFSGYKPNEEMFDMAIEALKCEPIVIRCKELLSKEDFEAVVKRIHEQNQNVIVIPCEAEVVSTIQEKHQLSEETPTNTSTKSTNTSIDISAEAPRPIEPTIPVDLESGIIPRSAIETRPHNVTKRYEK